MEEKFKPKPIDFKLPLDELENPPEWVMFDAEINKEILETHALQEFCSRCLKAGVPRENIENLLGVLKHFLEERPTYYSQGNALQFTTTSTYLSSHIESGIGISDRLHSDSRYLEEDDNELFTPTNLKISRVLAHTNRAAYALHESFHVYQADNAGDWWMNFITSNPELKEKIDPNFALTSSSGIFPTDVKAEINTTPNIFNNEIHEEITKMDNGSQIGVINEVTMNLESLKIFKELVDKRPEVKTYLIQKYHKVMIEASVMKKEIIDALSGQNTDESFYEYPTTDKLRDLIGQAGFYFLMYSQLFENPKEVKDFIANYKPKGLSIKWLEYRPDTWIEELNKINELKICLSEIVRRWEQKKNSKNSNTPTQNASTNESSRELSKPFFEIEDGKITNISQERELKEYALPLYTPVFESVVEEMKRAVEEENVASFWEDINKIRNRESPLQFFKELNDAELENLRDFIPNLIPTSQDEDGFTFLYPTIIRANLLKRLADDKPGEPDDGILLRSVFTKYPLEFSGQAIKNIISGHIKYKFTNNTNTQIQTHGAFGKILENLDDLKKAEVGKLVDAIDPNKKYTQLETENILLEIARNI